MDQIDADAALRQVVLDDCGWVTPEIHMKWDSLQPGRERWNTEPADALVVFARRHALKVRGHALLWDQSTPSWAKGAMSARRDWSLIEDYFRTVVGRYADHVHEWDVINEPIGDTGRADGLRETCFFKAFGPDYIPNALKTARALAPNARLAINDYGFEYDNPVEQQRRDAFLRLLERLKRSDTPIDAVGIQAHLDLGKGPIRADILRPFFSAIADLGLGIAITELDVKEVNRSLPVADRDGRVADEVRRYLDIALDEPAVTGVTTWGLNDHHSWLQPPNARGNSLIRALPYDADWQPKPMRTAIMTAMAETSAPARP